jgi:hypothetical protein
MLFNFCFKIITLGDIVVKKIGNSFPFPNSNIKGLDGEGDKFGILKKFELKKDLLYRGMNSNPNYIPTLQHNSYRFRIGLA